MMNLRCLPVLAGLLLAGGCDDDGVDPGPGPGPDATLRVSNESDFVIEEIYLTEGHDPDWGANLLGGDVLFPDEDLTLGVDCGFYDALLVDEDGVECELQDLDLCLNDADWVIRNNTCSVFGAAKAAREAAAAAQGSAQATGSDAGSNTGSATQQ